MKWSDDLLLCSGHPDTPLRGQLQLAMYAIHLSLGNNIFCKSLRANTIEQYILAVASFLLSHTGIDFRRDRPSDLTFGRFLTPVYKELRRYDTVPTRREPYTVEMHSVMRQITGKAHPLSMTAALNDWFEMGLLAGFRLSEWAQPNSHPSPYSPQRIEKTGFSIPTRAFVPNDFRAEVAGVGPVSGLTIATHPVSSITKLWVRYRVQKNGQNGEERLYVRNPTEGGHCFVSSAHRALQRFITISRLVSGLNPASTPLAIYWDNTGKRPRSITSSAIDECLRALAQHVYHLDPVKDSEHLQRWGSHSLRVGACVVLHSMNFSALDIQWLLRWRSTAFMDYLRNNPLLPQRQFHAVDRAAAMPNWLHMT